MSSVDDKALSGSGEANGLQAPGKQVRQLRNLERLTAVLPDPALLLAEDLTVVFANRAFGRLVGLRESELEQRRRGVCHQILGLETCKETCLAARARLAGRPLRADEVVAQFNDLRFNVVSIPISDPSAPEVTHLEVYRDVTGESRMQDQYRVLLAGERQQKEQLHTLVRERTVELERLVKELGAKNTALEQLAFRDALTGLYNHRSFQQHMREEVARSARSGSAMALVLADVDHFKSINDTYGHPTGDDCLRVVAKTLSAGVHAIRQSDFVARYGGEEFAILLHDSSREGALAVAERLRNAFEQELAGLPSLGRPLTLSFGLACFPEDATSGPDLLSRADQALLLAKRQGRNRVVLWSQVQSNGVKASPGHQDTRSLLFEVLRSERILDVITLQLMDLENLQRNYGAEEVQFVSQRFQALAREELDRSIASETRLEIVTVDQYWLDVYLRHSRNTSVRSLESLAERICGRVENQLAQELGPRAVGLARVIAGHASQMYAPGLTPERQLEKLREAVTYQAQVAQGVRRTRDRFEIQRLIVEGQLECRVQPILEASGATLGFEALARGLGGQGSRPLLLLDHAEDAGLIVELDLCMIRAAFAGFKRLGDKQALCFINTLPRTLALPGFCRGELLTRVQESGLEPRQIVIEVSERDSLQGRELAKALAELKRLGFAVALDDVGTRNANLAEIAEIRPDWLKLDRVLVRSIGADPVKRDLLMSVIQFAHRQQARIIAEGIETPEELETLKRLGVDGFQGFLLGRPRRVES